MSKKDTNMKPNAMYVNYIKSQNDDDDLVFVKERFKDGTFNIKLLVNYKRDWYYTKKIHRNHKQKKLYEEINKLNKVSSTQSKLEESIKKTLRIRNGYNLKQLSRSPYLYGSDVHVATIVKKEYTKRFGIADVLPVVAFSDFEWGEHRDHKEMICGSTVFEASSIKEDPTIHLVLNKNWNSSYNKEGISKIHDMFNAIVKPQYTKIYNEKNSKAISKKLNIDLNEAQSIIDSKGYGIELEKFFTENNIDYYPVPNFKLNIEIKDNELDMTKAVFAEANRLGPDYFAFWNGIADLTKVEGLAEHYKVPLRDIICDNNNIFPNKFRYAKVERGATVKKDANNNSKSVDDYMVFNTLRASTTWMYICMMVTYAQNMSHKANRNNGYGLDAVLKDEIGFGKLTNFNSIPDTVDKLSKDLWHRTMSEDYPLEYAIYNIWDNIGPYILEDFTTQIKLNFHMRMGDDPIWDFTRSTKKLSNRDHFLYLDKHRVISSVSDRMKLDFEYNAPPPSGIVITLNPDFNYGMEYNLDKDNVGVKYKIIPQGSDSDIRASYPWGQLIMNLGRDTIKSEVYKIEGLNQFEQNDLCMDLSFTRDGVGTHLYRDIYKYPGYIELAEKYIEDKNRSDGDN